METLLEIVVVQSLNLVVFLWINRVGCFRVLALRQQLAVYRRKAKKPKLRNRDMLFWSLLSKVWRDWSSELILVRPETVIRWRKRKFREFWRSKSHLAEIHEGLKLSVLGSREDWLQVALPNGITGWVRAEDVGAI